MVGDVIFILLIIFIFIFLLVGAQLSRETGASPQSETALEFCLHCVNALPFLYINNNDVAHGNLDRISIRSNKDETVNNMAVGKKLLFSDNLVILFCNMVPFSKIIEILIYHIGIL